MNGPNKNRGIKKPKKGRLNKTRDGENSTGNSGNGKILTLSSQMQSALCTDGVMSQDYITKMIGLYNQTK